MDMLIILLQDNNHINCHCSVMTPYYSEETVYSKSDLEMENEDGVSIIYYLQKIYPGLLNLHQLTCL